MKNLWSQLYRILSKVEAFRYGIERMSDEVGYRGRNASELKHRYPLRGVLGCSNSSRSRVGCGLGSGDCLGEAVYLVCSPQHQARGVDLGDFFST